jgi:hypothetical protein
MMYLLQWTGNVFPLAERMWFIERNENLSAFYKTTVVSFKHEQTNIVNAHTNSRFFSN